MRKFILTIGLVAIVSACLFAGPVSAIDIGDTGLKATADEAKLTTKNTDIPNIVGTIINTFLGLLGLILLGIIIYGAFLWMTAGGNEPQVKKAQSFFVNGIVGLAIALLAYFIASFVIKEMLDAWMI